ncbi:MAG: 50S ribosomal protein L6 [Gammaproteobacteria bacterium]|nr:50S ribosomal protein L6 [Gammaproteobacteria bacterium]
MSRVANNPVELPSGVEFSIAENTVTIKGSKGEMQHHLHPLVSIRQEGSQIKMAMNNESKSANALAGTTRALLQNIVTGVSVGFERKLTIIGVGYRAQVQGKVLDLTLGFSHPVKFEIPEGITIETPSQTEIVVKGIDKQKVGQVAADIRAFRPPEPYKGKGVRYADENVVRKEAKKT